LSTQGFSSRRRFSPIKSSSLETGWWRILPCRGCVWASFDGERRRRQIPPLPQAANHSWRPHGNGGHWWAAVRPRRTVGQPRGMPVFTVRLVSSPQIYIRVPMRPVGVAVVEDAFPDDLEMAFAVGELSYNLGVDRGKLVAPAYWAPLHARRGPVALWVVERRLRRGRRCFAILLAGDHRPRTSRKMKKTKSGGPRVAARHPC